MSVDVSETVERTAMVAAKVEPWLLARVRAAAERDGRTVSNWVRQLLLEQVVSGKGD